MADQRRPNCAKAGASPIFAPAKLGLPEGRPLDIAKVIAQPVVLLQDSSDIEVRLLEVANRKQMTLNIVYSSEQSISVFEMVAAALEVAILPECFSRRARRRKLLRLPLKDTNLRLRFSAVIRADQKVSSFMHTVLAGITRGAAHQGAMPVRAAMLRERAGGGG